VLLPQKKEREYRFKLALRMGLPIFALIIALISHTLVSSYESLDLSFYIESILLVIVSIYFIFYLIYRGFDVKITDAITQTFSREYLYDYLNKEISKEKNYTLVLLSIDNLQDINSLYGIKNGDKVLLKFAKHIGEYFEEKQLGNFPLGHLKSGDFILGFSGEKKEYHTLFEILCLKLSDYKVDDIEVKISGAIVDTSFSQNLEYLMDKLFDLQEANKNFKKVSNNMEINPSELEHFVIKAMREKSFLFLFQDVFSNKEIVMKECFIKLKMPQDKLIHPKSYLKVLNKLGLMLDFDLMILEEIIKNYMQANNYIFALSISPKSLRNRVFTSRVKELLQDHKELQNRVMFVLSESEYFPHIEKFKTLLNSLRDAGVLITIDRVGAVQTSFLYLRELDIDCIRFDPLYTKEIQMMKSRSIIEGFNTIAHKNSIKSWIKMLEEKEAYEWASDLGIDYIQGKYLASLQKNTQG
jgi:EAL domain-containing protein (putative c-di-GMP-specific phosphodiesterase class I)/GGDEF domain-containing protein